ncbi:hypothetical protein ACVINW_004874 [Bradyrhizobium sp. USDA 4461]
MSLLGFDAIGRLALGQMRVSGSNVLVGGTGSYIVGRNAAIFGLGETAWTAGYAIAANAAALSSKLNGGAGNYNESGAAALLSIGVASSGTNYAVTGNSVKTTMMLSVGVGSYIVAYDGVAGAVALNAGSVAYQVIGKAAALSRDYVNWWPAEPIASNWVGETAPSPAWGTSATIPPSWIAAVPMGSAWTPQAAPASNWTAESDQEIPDPVAN